MENKDVEPSWAYGRGLSVFQGLPDPGPIEDLEDSVKVDKRKAELESQAKLIACFSIELDRIQAQLTGLRKWVNAYYRKPVPMPKEGLSVIES